MQPYVSKVAAMGTVGKYGVVAQGHAQGFLGKFVLVCIDSFRSWKP